MLQTVPNQWFCRVDQAPFDVPLILMDIRSQVLAQRLRRLGVFPGDVIVRLDEHAASGAARVLLHSGQALLSGGVAAKVIVHHDDGHTTPVIEMQPGEKGHVEGLLCGELLREGLEILGIGEQSWIQMVRRQPSVSYDVLLDGKRLLLPEGMATKVWGQTAGQCMQLALTEPGRPFQVLRLLGGRRAGTIMRTLGIAPGKTVILKEISLIHCFGEGLRRQIVLSVDSRMRLYLRPDQAEAMAVRLLGDEFHAWGPGGEATGELIHVG